LGGKLFSQSPHLTKELPMTTDYAPIRNGTKLAAAAAAAAAAAVIVGSMVLVGWALDIAALKSILPGWVSMKANTAVCFILIGVALWLTARSPATLTPKHSILFSRLARLCGLLAGLIGLLTLGEYIFGWNPGIDHWLVSEPVGTVGTSHPGRMAPETALNFVLLSVALWFAGGSRQTRWSILASVSFGLLVATLALAAVLSYLTPGLGAYGWFGLTIMAVHTAILFALLGMAVIAISWQPEVLSWSLSRNTTAAFACGMAVLVFIGLNTSRSQFWMKETNNKIAHIEQMQGDTESLQAEVIDAHVHARDYLITGEERFLKLYLLAKADSHAKLDELSRAELATAEPDHQQHFAHIDAQIKAQFQWLQKMMDASRTVMTDVARNNMISHTDGLLNGLRTTLGQAKNDDRQLSQQLKRESESMFRSVSLTIFTGTVASLIIFLIVVFRLNLAVNEREQRERALHESEEKFRKITESAQDAIIMMGADQRISFWNAAAERLFGYSAAETLGQELHPLITPVSAHAAFAQAFPHFQETGDGALIGKVTEVTALRKGGEEFPVELSISATRLNGQWHAVSMVRDITGRKVAEAKIQRLNQLYNLLSQCNQAVVRSVNQEELFQHICRDAVNIGGMKLVWIGLVDEASQRVVPAASYGEGMEYLEGIQISVNAGDASGQDPIGMVIRENQPLWCQDFMHDPLTAPRHELGARLGWGAKAALPLHRNGVAIGVLTLYSGTVNAFDEEARRTLVEMAMDISHALEHFAVEAERKAAELQLVEHELQYRTLADSGQAMIWTSGADKLCNYFNQPWLKFTGRTLEQELGNGWAEGVHPDDLAQCLATYVGAFDRHESFSMAYRLRRHDGEYRWIQDDGSPRYNAEGEFVGYIGYGMDITERKQAEHQLARQLRELTTWREATLGREMRVLELKHEVNELLGQTGQPPRYPSAEGNLQEK
jgi:PAS domain S-box-containing protein